MKRVVKFLITLAIVLLTSFPAFAGQMEVHFIDAGQADAIFITCDGKNMLLDGGSKEDSDLIYAYLKDNKIERLDYIICTHDDEDHVGGIPGAISYVKKNIGTVLAPYKTSEKDRFNVFVKQLNKYGKNITVPKKSAEYKLGDAKFKVLSFGVEDNDASMVIRLEHGKNSFLFMGDATEETEKTILDSKELIESTVLKVGHHGSDTSTSYKFLREVNPKYAVICVGKDNKYGHPTDTVLSRLKDQGSTIYRTDNNGDVVFTSNGTKLSVKTEKSFKVSDNLIAGTGNAKKGTDDSALLKSNVSKESCQVQQYILNTNTKKFHRPGCKSVNQMKEKNKKTVNDTRDNIISLGYDPCKNCNP